MTAALLLTAVLAGCTAPEGSILDMEDDAADMDISPAGVTGTKGTVGGSVKNSPPTVQSFTTSATQGENRGDFTITLSGSVKDANTENQIANISVHGVGGVTIAANHVVTADERAAASAPASFGPDGFKVWTGTKNDGVLEFQYRYTFPAFTPAGPYVFTAHVADTPGSAATSAPVTVTLTRFSDITIDPTPVGADGGALPGQNWGQWEAEASAQNVASSNYIRLVNTGDTPASRVVIDFADAFVGAPDANFSIPVANNVQFAWAEAAPGAAPSSLTFDYAPANSEGTTTVTFTAQNNVIYVTYRIVQLPDVLPVQSYGIAYTVTDLTL